LLTKATPFGTLSYSYDAAGDLLSVNSSNVNGASDTYSYDALNRLASVTDVSGTTSYGYDAVGNLSTFAYPNGVSHSYTYNTLNRLTQMGASKGGTALSSYAYTLGAAGNRLSVSELTGRTVQYAYDDIYRLTSETIAGAVSQNGVIGYNYDAVGNRTAMTSTVAAIPPGLFNYDANDQLTTDTYDSDGNTVSSGGISNSYDFENHLVRHGNVTIVYDGDGNRVAETVGGVTTNYLVDTNNLTGWAQVVDELHSGTVSRTYSYGLERISETQRVTGVLTTSFYGYDGHGSVRQLFSSTGATTDAYDYDAFGNLLSSTGTTPNNYLFAGEQFDPALGLYYNRARYLDTNTGRFWSMDTDEGNITDPRTLHKYLYAGADPVDNVDPSGNQFDLGSLAISTAIYATIGAISGIVINGINNYVLGNPIFQGAGGAAAFGAAALPLSVAFPLVGLVLAGLGIAGAGVTAWSVFTSGNASTGQKAGAIFLVALSLYGAYSAASSALNNGLWINVKYPNLGSVFATRVGSMSRAIETIRARISDFDDVIANWPPKRISGVTLAIGIARDQAGNLRTIVGTSEANGYMRPDIKPLLQPGDIIAPGKSAHAEVNIVRYSNSQGWTLIAVGATNGICETCAPEIAAAGAECATPLKK
jgi:RHS repeat-associated protein